MSHLTVHQIIVTDMHVQMIPCYPQIAHNNLSLKFLNHPTETAIIPRNKSMVTSISSCKIMVITKLCPWGTLVFVGFLRRGIGPLMASDDKVH